MYNRYKQNQHHKQNRPQYQREQEFPRYNYLRQEVDAKDQGNMPKRDNPQNNKWSGQQDKKQFREDRSYKFSHPHDKIEKPLKYRQKKSFHRQSPQKCSSSESSDSYRSHKQKSLDSQDGHDFQDFRNSFEQKSNNSFSKGSYNYNNKQKPVQNHSQRMLRQVGFPQRIKNSKQANFKDDDGYLLTQSNRPYQAWQHQQKRSKKRRQESSTNSSHKAKKQYVELFLYGQKYEVGISSVKNLKRSVLKICQLISKNEIHKDENQDESKKLQIAIRLIILDKICSKFESEYDLQGQDYKLSIKFGRLLKETVNKYKHYCPPNLSQ